MRIVAGLQITDSSRAIKTLKFKEKIYLGDPINIVNILNQKGAQEIALIDIHASKTQRPDFDFIRRISHEISVPLSYGGGISLNTDIKQLTSLGVERFITSQIMKDDNQLIRKLVSVLGSSSVGVSIDIESFEVKEGNFFVTLRGMHSLLPLDLLLDEIINLKVGEVIIRPIELDGTNGDLSLSYYTRLFHFTQSVQRVVENCQLLLGAGIRTMQIAEDLKSNLPVDGHLVGSMVSLSRSGGVIISYPKQYNIL